MSRYNDEIEREWIKRDIEEATLQLYGSSSVCCFSVNPTDQRFWAQYAERGTGYALLFDFRTPWRMRTFLEHPAIDMVPMPVRYIDGLARPTLKLAFGKSDRDRAFEELEAAVLSKSAQWRDQNEQRIVRVGIQGGHMEFPSASLCGLAIGYATAQEHRHLLLDLRAARGEWIPVYEARPSREQYGLELHVVD